MYVCICDDLWMYVSTGFIAAVIDVLLLQLSWPNCRFLFSASSSVVNMEAAPSSQDDLTQAASDAVACLHAMTEETWLRPSASPIAPRKPFASHASLDASLAEQSVSDLLLLLDDEHAQPVGPDMPGGSCCEQRNMAL